MCKCGSIQDMAFSKELVFSIWSDKTKTNCKVNSSTSEV